MAFFCSGVNPYSFEWDDVGSQVTALATGLYPGTYTFTVTNQIGCRGIESITLITAAPSQEICIVTVDETSPHNLISWEKPITTGIDSFRSLIHYCKIKRGTHMSSSFYYNHLTRVILQRAVYLLNEDQYLFQCCIHRY